MSDSSTPRDDDLSDLVKRVLGGDSQAAAEFVRRFDPLVRATVRKAVKSTFGFDVEDGVQDAWLRVFTTLRQWRGTGLYAYVAAVSYSAAIDAVRHSLKDPRTVPFDETNAGTAATDVPVDKCEEEEQVVSLQRAAAGMSDPRHRRVLDLRLKEMTFAEIGREIGMSESWARITWKQVLRYLTESIDTEISQRRKA